MGSSSLSIHLAFLFVVVGHTYSVNDVRFDQNYVVSWANNHASFLDQGREIQLSLDQSSGAGFMSKLSYVSGFFHMKMKLPAKDSTGVITTFYLNSSLVHHNELDIEFLGNSSVPYTLQTNVFANGEGNREQRFLLWFDPTTDFHDYQILWNQHQIVFYVDNIPIRVFKNNTRIGVSYPSSPMQIVGSLWTAQWASGEKKINWTQAPFQAHYRNFEIQGCQYQKASNPLQCQSSKLWWNTNKYWELSPYLKKVLHTVRHKYMYYDYCSDKSRFQYQPPECKSNL